MTDKYKYIDMIIFLTLLSPVLSCTGPGLFCQDVLFDPGYIVTTPEGQVKYHISTFLCIQLHIQDMQYVYTIVNIHLHWLDNTCVCV